MVRFFEAINGRSATEEEIAAELAAGGIQDDSPSSGAQRIQHLPMYKKRQFRAPAQPVFAAARDSPQEAANHNQHLLVLQEAPVQGSSSSTRFCRVLTDPGQAVPNQAFQPQAGFANRCAGSQQAAFANGQLS